MISLVPLVLSATSAPHQPPSYTRLLLYIPRSQGALKWASQRAAMGEREFTVEEVPHPHLTTPYSPDSGLPLS